MDIRRVLRKEEPTPSWLLPNQVVKKVEPKKAGQENFVQRLGKLQVRRIKV